MQIETIKNQITENELTYETVPDGITIQKDNGFTGFTTIFTDFTGKQNISHETFGISLSEDYDASFMVITDMNCKEIGDLFVNYDIDWTKILTITKNTVHVDLRNIKKI
jgi:hypothetical protein